MATNDFLHDALVVTKWVDLRVGERVAIQRQGHYLRTGYVDDITFDSKAFWVNMDEGRGRVLVHDGDMTMVRRDPSG